MPADGRGVQYALVRGIAHLLEEIAGVQGVPGEEDVEEYAEFDGSELPPIDPDTVTYGDLGLSFRLRSGQVVLVSVQMPD